MIRKKLFYNIHYADYACISGTPPHDSGSATAFVFIRPACGNNYSTLLHKKHEDHSIMTAVLTEVFFFLITRKNESIIMICSLPLLLNHPPITVEIPAAESVVELETASFEKTFQLLSQRVNMNLPKNLLFKTSDCFHSFVSPDSFLSARRKCQMVEWAKR